MDNQVRRERINGSLSLYVNAAHRFGTDAFLLADFCSVRKGETACDFGTGCGIIPILWHREPDRAPEKVYGVELQQDAAALFQASVRDCRLQGRVEPVCADLRDSGLPAAAFDLVSCNPPYKKANAGILSRTESDRLARHETSCSLAELSAAAGRLLRFGGRFCLCQRPERLVDIFESMRSEGMEPKRIRFVQHRADKAPWLVLVEGRKGGRPFLTVEPPLLMEGESGGFSQEVLRIYRKV